MNAPHPRVEEGARVLKLSLSSFAWIDRPIAEPFPQLAALGIKRLQVFMEPGHFTGEGKGDAAALKRAADEHRVELVSLHAPIGDTDPASPSHEVWDATALSLEHAVETAEALGIRRLVIHPHSVEKRTEQEHETGINLFADRLSTVKRTARRHGVSLYIENLPGGAFGGPSRRLLSLDHSQFCLDLGHAHIGGELPDVIDAFGPALGMLHIHDNDGESDAHLCPGRGSIDWRALERRLVAAAFHGEYCLEIAGGDDLERTLQFCAAMIRENRFYPAGPS